MAARIAPMQTKKTLKTAMHASSTSRAPPRLGIPSASKMEACLSILTRWAKERVTMMAKSRDGVQQSTNNTIVKEWKCLPLKCRCKKWVLVSKYKARITVPHLFVLHHGAKEEAVVPL